MERAFFIPAIELLLRIIRLIEIIDFSICIDIKPDLTLLKLLNISNT